MQVICVQGIYSWYCHISLYEAIVATVLRAIVAGDHLEYQLIYILKLWGLWQ